MCVHMCKCLFKSRVIWGHFGTSSVSAAQEKITDPKDLRVVPPQSPNRADIPKFLKGGRVVSKIANRNVAKWLEPKWQQIFTIEPAHPSSAFVKAKLLMPQLCCSKPLCVLCVVLFECCVVDPFVFVGGVCVELCVVVQFCCFDVCAC